MAVAWLASRLIGLIGESYAKEDTVIAESIAYEKEQKNKAFDARIDELQTKFVQVNKDLDTIRGAIALKQMGRL